MTSTRSEKAKQRRPERSLAASLLRVAGWRLVYEAPDVRRAVVIFAPHTSNWDFPLLLLARGAISHRVRYLAKHTLFRFPFAWFFSLTGGIPVERGEHHRVVDAMVELFASEPDLWLALAPEGTRAKTDHWRSGFYHVALAAKVPILFAFVDAARRQCGVGGVLEPSGDVEADLARIRTFYADKRGIRPELAGEIRFSPGA